MSPRIGLRSRSRKIWSIPGFASGTIINQLRWLFVILCPTNPPKLSAGLDTDSNRGWTLRTFCVWPPAAIPPDDFALLLGAVNATDVVSARLSAIAPIDILSDGIGCAIIHHAPKREPGQTTTHRGVSQGS